MRHLARAALGALAIALAACGTDSDPLVPGLLGAARGALTGGDAAPDLRAQLTPAVLAQIPTPLILVEIPAAPSAAGLGLAGSNGGYITWSAQNGTLVVTRGGIVTGTRGLGFDLMNAATGDTLAALRAGGGRSLREHRYLDGEGKVVVRRFACTIVPAGEEIVRLIPGTVQTAKMVETCKGALGGVFENMYWNAGTGGPLGGIVKSRQWVSPEIGYLLVEHVK